MNNMIEAVQRHLGRSLTEAQLDYYGVLGLELFCDDQAQISSALKKAADAWRTSDTKSYPDSAQQVAKVLRQAQAVLLDAAKKPNYDKQLAQLRGLVLTATSSAAATASLPSKTLAASNANRFEDDAFNKLLPAGDPWQEFKFDAYDQDSSTSSIRLAQDIEHRKARLRLLFPSLYNEGIEGSVSPHATDLNEASSEPEQEIFETSQVEQRSNRSSTQTHLESIKKRRLRRQWMTVGGVVLASCGLLGYSVFLFVRNQSQVAQADKDTKRDSSLNEPVASDAPTLRTNEPKENGVSVPKQDSNKKNSSVKSNLPSIKRSDDTMSTTGDMASMEPSGKPVDGKTNDKAPPSAEPSQPVIETKPVVEMKPEMVKPEMAKPESNLASAKPVTGEMEKPIMMNTKEWASLMKKSREAIDKTDFPTFESTIEAALQLAQTEEAKAKTARLDQLGQLYKIFIESESQARSKLRGTEALTVGGTKINIVEVTPEKLVVRSKGGNESHAWNKLPPGIAMALADLTLSDSEPVDVAARAVYFTISPATNDIMRKRAKGWFEKSVGKGSVRADLQQALTDTYE